MYIPCPKCKGRADLKETKADRTRVFKCRNKKCGEVQILPPFVPPPKTW